MNLQAMAIGLAIVLAGATPLFAHGYRITCGETQRHHTFSDTVIELYEFEAEAGEVYSFQSTVDGAVPSEEWGVWPYVTLQNQSGSTFYPDSTGEAWLCSWRVVKTGVYHIEQYGLASPAVGADVSLTMYCGSPPAGCLVPVTPTTWSRVKTLFR